MEMTQVPLRLHYSNNQLPALHETCLFSSCAKTVKKSSLLR